MVPYYGKCLETGKITKSLEYGRCIEKGNIRKSLEECSRDFVVFPVSKHFLYFKNFVVSPVCRHFSYSKNVVVSPFFRDFWTDVGSGLLIASCRRHEARREKFSR